MSEIQVAEAEDAADKLAEIEHRLGAELTLDVADKLLEYVKLAQMTPPGEVHLLPLAADALLCEIRK